MSVVKRAQNFLIKLITREPIAFKDQALHTSLRGADPGV